MVNYKSKQKGGAADIFHRPKYQPVLPPPQEQERMQRENFKRQLKTLALDLTNKLEETRIEILEYKEHVKYMENELTEVYNKLNNFGPGKRGNLTFRNNVEFDNYIDENRIKDLTKYLKSYTIEFRQKI